MLLGNSASIIRDSQAYLAIASIGVDANFPAAPIQQSVLAVYQKVENDILKLTLAHGSLRYGPELRENLDVLFRKGGTNQQYRLLNYFIHIDESVLPFLRPDEAEKTLGDFDRSVGGLLNRIQISLDGIQVAAHLGELRVSLDTGQQVIEFMRYPAYQNSQGIHLF
jgi:hypothetical protein